ncbi:MAG TPA: response regulator [Bacteroidia bacterium]
MKTTKKLGVLVVEDDRTYNSALVHYLQGNLKDQANVTGCQTGEQSIDLIEQKPDVVILDYFLNSRFASAMNGLSVLDIVKKRSPGSEIIMVSGQDKIDIAVKAMNHGAFNYVVKGESAFLQIGKSIRNVMHLRKLQKDSKWARISVLSTIAGAILLVGFLLAIQVFAPQLFNN